LSIAGAANQPPSFAAGSVWQTRESNWDWWIEFESLAKFPASDKITW
jgi:hypothetical protein